METRSISARTISMMSLRCLRRLVLQSLPKILPSSSARFLKTFKSGDGEHTNNLPATVVTESLDLPVDIVMNIFALLDVPDLIRAGSVCSSWYDAYNSVRNLGMYRWPQTPCLLYTSESDPDDVACLYSLTEKRVYKLTLPDPPIRRRYLIGSSDGWLVTADERSELHIVNPITGDQVKLPSVTTIEHVKPIYDDAGALDKYEFSQHFGEGEEICGPSVHALDELRDYLYVKAFLFSESSSGILIVVLIHNPKGQLSFAKAGDRGWTWLPPGVRYEDCVYMDGLLYAVTSIGGIDAFDLTDPTVSRKVIMDRSKDFICERLYLVQAPCGALLQVWRDQDFALTGAEREAAPERENYMDTREIMVYKVDMDEKELVEEVNGLRGRVLFLGLSESLCTITELLPQLKANHVYLTDDDTGFALRKSYRRDIGVFIMENNSMEEIASPQLWCSWPAPIWITPNLSEYE